MKHRLFTHPERSLPNPISSIIVEDKQKKYRKHIVTIDSRDRNTSLYPNPENYVIELLKPYKNITQVELIGSLVPKSGYTVTEGFNDTLYITEDTDFIDNLTSGSYQCEPNVILCEEKTNREKDIDHYKSGKPGCDEGCFRTGHGNSSSLLPAMISINKSHVKKVTIPPGNYKHINTLIDNDPTNVDIHTLSGLSVNTCPSSCGTQCANLFDRSFFISDDTKYNEFANVLTKSINSCMPNPNYQVIYSQYTGKYSIISGNKFAIINYNCAKAHGHYESRKDTQLTYEVIDNINNKIIFGTKNKSEFLNHILSNKSTYFVNEPSCQDGTKILQLLTDHINFRYQNKIDNFTINSNYSFRAYYRTHFYGNYERQYPPCSIAPTLGFKTLNVSGQENEGMYAIQTHFPANLDGEQYAMLTIPTFGRLTGQSRFMRKSFAIIELDEKYKEYPNSRPYGAIKNFHPPLPKLDKLDIKFYRFDKSNQRTLYDFNGRDHMLVFSITTLL